MLSMYIALGVKSCKLNVLLMGTIVSVRLVILIRQYPGTGDIHLIDTIQADCVNSYHED